jgi:DNA-binding transcriptional MerR regulator
MTTFDVHAHLYDRRYTGECEHPDVALLRASSAARRARQATSGQRDYPASAVGVVRAIKGAQRLGFTPKEIQELRDPSKRARSGDDIHRRAHAKMVEVESKIAELERVRLSLQAARDAKCDSLTDCSCGRTSITLQGGA